MQSTTRSRDAGLVLLSLFGPAAWSAFLVINYVLEDPIACQPGASVKGEILGVGVRTIAGGVSVVLGAATVLAVLVSFVMWQRLRTENSTGRPAWMALAGVLNNALFGIVILVGLAPVFVLRTCTVTP